MDINDELAELTYQNRLLKQEVRDARQERTFFARRQAAVSILIIAALIVLVAVSLSL